MKENCLYFTVSFLLFVHDTCMYDWVCDNMSIFHFPAYTSNLYWTFYYLFSSLMWKSNVQKLGHKLFNSHNKTNKCIYVRCVCHLLFVHQHVLVAVTIIIRVNDKNIRNPNKFANICRWSIQFLQRMSQNLLYSH